jgi:hypothetical protein
VSSTIFSDAAAGVYEKSALSPTLAIMSLPLAPPVTAFGERAAMANAPGSGKAI